jgi:hypothetical protein|tara:strand:+ start:1444 stop:1728 length:285 start_codon:yes stop_codon:yes gene_type:complete
MGDSVRSLDVLKKQLKDYNKLLENYEQQYISELKNLAFMIKTQSVEKETDAFKAAKIATETLQTIHVEKIKTEEEKAILGLLNSALLAENTAKS